MRTSSSSVGVGSATGTTMSLPLCSDTSTVQSSCRLVSSAKGRGMRTARLLPHFWIRVFIVSTKYTRRRGIPEVRNPVRRRNHSLSPRGRFRVAKPAVIFSVRPGRLRRVSRRFLALVRNEQFCQIDFAGDAEFARGGTPRRDFAPCSPGFALHKTRTVPAQRGYGEVVWRVMRFISP